MKALPLSRRRFLKVGCCAAAVMKPLPGAGLNIRPTEREMIFSRNAARLLGV